jgi:hypothetical protein
MLFRKPHADMPHIYVIQGFRYLFPPSEYWTAAENERITLENAQHARQRDREQRGTLCKVMRTCSRICANMMRKRAGQSTGRSESVPWHQVVYVIDGTNRRETQLRRSHKRFSVSEVQVDLRFSQPFSGTTQGCSPIHRT